MTKALEDGHAQFVARSAEDLTLTCVPVTQWRRGPWHSAWAPADTRLESRAEKLTRTTIAKLRKVARVLRVTENGDFF